MESLPKNKLFEHRPDTFTSIREEYNLSKPGMMVDAIRILREWIEKQQHFRKKDFPDVYLETSLIGCKGSIERAKFNIEHLCTYKTLLPHFFGPYNVKTDFGNLLDVMHPVVLPKMTSEHYRVVLLKISNKLHLIKDLLNLYIYIIIVGEFFRKHEYCRGFITILDFTEINIMNLLAILNPVQLKQFLHICIEGFGMRLKGVHVFTSSKLIDTFISILKQVLSPKLSRRIYTHKSLESLPDIVPLENLPKDYGGNERSVKEILDTALEVLSSKEHREFLEEMCQATVDETYRLSEDFNEHYAGMPGTFKMLHID